MASTACSKLIAGSNLDKVVNCIVALLWPACRKGGHNTQTAARLTSQKSARNLIFQRGQASVEYAIVLVGFLALVMALGAINNFLSEGKIMEHALRTSSHAIEGIDIDTLKDVMCV